MCDIEDQIQVHAERSCRLELFVQPRLGICAQTRLSSTRVDGIEAAYRAVEAAKKAINAYGYHALRPSRK